MAFLYDELAALVRDGALDEKLVDKLSQYVPVPSKAPRTHGVVCAGY
jgi:hypothetical protein